uniref:restriction endonuclease, SacI family n=1 Tax=Sphingomonas sp. PWP1-2 TaxID=2804558 RepID=UPI003CFA453E
MVVAKADIDKRIARGVLYEEAAKAAAGHIDQSWARPIEELSEAATATSLTHIAFLGTAILAKCVDPTIDVFAVKKSAGPK